MSGRVGDLSPAQEAALTSFKAAVVDIPNKPDDSDYYYLRWLRAHKFNLEKALDKFRNHMSVREEYGLDTILEDWTPPEVLKKFNPGGFFGEDRDGHPVWYDRIGRMDLKGFYRSVKREDAIRAKLHQLERRTKLCKEHSAKYGKVIEAVTIVLDMEGVSIQKSLYWPGMDLVRQVIRCAEDHAPETSRRTFVINAPSIFPFLYTIVKPMLDERTRDKIKVLGSNWREEIQQYIAPDQLPQAYGGTRCEPDPECTDHIRPGGDIPESYYLTNMTSCSKEEMKRALVSSGRSHIVEMEVTIAGSMLKWEFLTDNYDIGFGVALDKVELISVERKRCHVFPESGAYLCEQAGVYHVIFDNTFSWTRSKQLYYSLELIPPPST